MKISKTILFSAAALLSGFCAVPAEAVVNVTGSTAIDVTSSLTEDYYVSSDGVLKLNLSDTRTFYGRFLGSSSKTSEGDEARTLGDDYNYGSGYYDIRESGGEIEIAGSGTLEYKGFSDISYYSASFQTTHGQVHGEYEQGFTSSLVGITTDGNVDTNKTAFSGTLTVSENAKLVVAGYLSQYVAYKQPQPELSASANVQPFALEVGYVGVSNLNLKDTATLSFASAPKNLLSEAFELGDEDTGPASGAEGIRRLNFLNNVKADVNTTIELGTDAASTSRIVISTDRAANDYGWDGKATIGKLSGTGRVYFISSRGTGGDVSITNRAEFFTNRIDAEDAASATASLTLNVSSRTSVLNYVHTLDAAYGLAGHQRTEAGEGEEDVLSATPIADVFLLCNTTLGTDSTGQFVVDNVLETATAVQLSAALSSGGGHGQIDASLWENIGYYIGTSWTSRAGRVTVQGTQILNNLQSLFIERQTIEDEAANRGYYEISRGELTTNNYRIVSNAEGSSVIVRTNGALIINQSENRDGYFAGRFYTTDETTIEDNSAANDGYVIKTGKGTFANLCSADQPKASINRLFIYEGTWMSDPESLGSGRVYVGSGGKLVVIANDVVTMSARLEGVSDIVFARNSIYTDEDGTLHGGLLNDDREFVVDAQPLNSGRFAFGEGSSEQDYKSAAGDVQILQAQDDFTGTVTVNKGMTLTLGNFGNDELDASFANASKITLEDGSDKIVAGRLHVISYQILPSLTATDGNSQLIFDGRNYDSVAVLTGQVNFNGVIDGAGSLVKAGTTGLSISTSSHTLATVGMTGTLALGDEGAIRASSGVVVLNGAVVRSDKNQTFSSLIGGKSSVVKIENNSTLTVGMTQDDLGKLTAAINRYYDGGGSRILYDAYYFATADKDAYVNSPDGLELDGIVGFSSSRSASVVNALGSVRPAHMNEEGTTEPFTVEHTLAYLKDPAKFANVFAHIYATIDAETFSEISTSDAWIAQLENARWVSAGITAGDSMKGVFDKLLNLADVRAFVAAAPAGWTSRELEDLLSFAETYNSDKGKSLFVSDASTGQLTLTRAGYRQLLDANVVKYMDLAGGVPETFYDFISLFTDDYKFRLTDENVNNLSDIYGLPTEAIRAAATSAEKYAEFEKVIGLSYEEGELPGFAGTLTGAVSLKKIGTETLRLTGVNTYTGATIVEGGELRVDWDAVPNTSAIQVGSDGLLTLVSAGEYADDPTGTEEENAAAREAHNVFKIAEGGVIYGSGTILKDGEGTLVVDSALGKKVEAELDFTGEIVVGKGALIVNVSDRESFAESVTVWLNKGTEFALNVADAEHTLSFDGNIRGGADAGDADNPRKSYFTKTGSGTLVVTNGDALGDVVNSFDLKVAAGTMRLNFKEHGTFRETRGESFTATLGKDATLVFDVAADRYTFNGLVAGEAGTTFEKTGAGTLVLDRNSSASDFWTVEELKLSAGALKLGDNSSYAFNKITTAAGTDFVVDGTLLLDIDAGETENNVFNGTLSGTGTIGKTGTGTLTLKDMAFSGAIKLEEGSLVIDVAEGEKNLGFSLEVEADPDRTIPTLEKTGAGTANFTVAAPDSINLKDVDLKVSAGTLKFNGAAVSAYAPNSIHIASGATLEITPATETDLVAVEDGLSGEGTFVFGSAQAPTSVTADAASIAAFTGTFRLGENVTLELAADVTSIGGIESGNPEARTGTVKFTTTETEISVNPNRDVAFTGTLEAGAAGTTLNVGGTGLLDVSGATLTNIASIAVGSGANVGVALDNALGVTLADGATLSLVGEVGVGDSYAGEVKVSGGNSKVGISFSGARAYTAGTGTAFSALDGLVENVTYQDGASAENVSLVISNLAGKDLTLALEPETASLRSILAAAETESAPVDFTRENVELATNAGGTLTLDTGAVAESGAIYRKTISGTGNFEKTGAGTLTLSAAEQTYTGATTVSAGTLAFGAGTTLATSGITVNSGATLQGGATLTAESASVTFASGSKYKLNISAGEALRYTGAVSITGTLDLEIAQDQTLRGEALSIFEYVGTGTASEIRRDQFRLGEGNDVLYVDKGELANGNLKVYVAQRDFRDVPADYHDGLDALLDILSVWARPEGGYLSDALSDEEYAIADALNRTSLGALGDEITKLSPLGFASMVTMPHAGFSADASSLSGRLEQRLYDASSAIWVYAQDVEFFAQAQGSTVDNGSGSDAATFDYNTYGALVGADVKFNKDVTAGVALAYDRGKAKLHDGGGKIDSDNVRATAFAGFLLNDYLALNVGAQVGYAKFDTKRNTLVGTNKGDTDAWHGGVFADFVGAYALAAWGETSRLDLLPHAGIAFSYYRTDKFEEKGSGSALATDSFNAFSLEASVGAKLNYAFEIDGHGARVGLDFSLIHEFLDDEVEIDSWISDSKFSTDARALSETTFSLAPSVSFDLTDKASVFLNYELRLGTESEVAHRANLGFRYRY